jgi:predicted  nucleic acid-binding Zn-ribbon protein
MHYAEIKDQETRLFALKRRFFELQYELEDTGEYNPEIDELQKEICEVIDDLAVNGTDTLGRWHVSVENELKTLKAEKAAIDRRIKATNNTLDFIKDTITKLLAITGQEQVKGSLYSYKRTRSVTTKVDTELLEEKYQGDVENVLRSAAVIPDYVTVKLDAKVSLVPDDTPLPDVFVVTGKDTVRFTKPRKSE